MPVSASPVGHNLKMSLSKAEASLPQTCLHHWQTTQSHKQKNNAFLGFQTLNSEPGMYTPSKHSFTGVHCRPLILNFIFEIESYQVVSRKILNPMLMIKISHDTLRPRCCRIERGHWPRQGRHFGCSRVAEIALSRVSCAWPHSTRQKWPELLGQASRGQDSYNDSLSPQEASWLHSKDWSGVQ